MTSCAQGSGDDCLVGDKGNDRTDGGPGFDYVQPGYRDGRVDWIESTEQMVEGCLDHPVMERLFRGNVGR